MGVLGENSGEFTGTPVVMGGDPAGVLGEIISVASKFFLLSSPLKSFLLTLG